MSSTTDATQGAREVRFASPVDFVLPARPGESRCPGGRRRRGNRARCPLSVAVIAVAGTVQAVEAPWRRRDRRDQGP